MYLIYLLCLCLSILALLTIIAKQVQKLRSTVLAYGKLKLHADQPTTYWTRVISQLTVPKYYFRHFYVIGLLFALECLVELSVVTSRGVVGPVLYLVKYFDTPEGSARISYTQSLICQCLLMIHLSKRVYECFFIERPSKTAVMHVTHYLVGIGFYGAVVFGTWLEAAVHFGVWSSDDITHWSSPSLLSTTIAILLFSYASYHQHICHCILASLRDHSKGYAIPRGDWFEWIVAPHYFADILIYLSFNILFTFKSHIMMAALIWTLCNLATTADETSHWYKAHFGDKYLTTFPKDRYRIIPFIY
ncbi:hypothetical protein K501DRAFT_228957, partial [Backusella circina FSU 941]